MKHFSRLCLLILSLGFTGILRAEIPKMIHYQGFVTESNNRPYTGNGYFKFALVNQPGTTTYWNFDGSAALGGAEPPGAAISLGVDQGLFSVLLGDTAVPNMISRIDSVIFASHNQVYLRLWFSEALAGPFVLVTPDSRIVSVGFAMAAQKLVDGAISGPELAPAVTLGGSPGSGELAVEKADGSRTISVQADIGSGNGGILLYTANGLKETVRLTGAENGTQGGFLGLKNQNGHATVQLSAQSGPEASSLAEIRLMEADGTVMAKLSNEGILNLSRGDGTSTLILDSDDVDGAGGISLKRSTGERTVRLSGDLGANGKGGLALFTGDGLIETVRLTGSRFGTGGGFAQFSKPNGTVTIQINGDHNGEGRITTQVLEITGGADLSESFEVASSGSKSKAGMIVCIDPDRPGELRVSDKRYDSTVAGIVSGAGGVKPGMLMGHKGTLADGKYPVALTGRVYCQLDASYGAIKPGDLITTSDTPGHGMKADPGIAAGAIVGKAMTSLAEGRGLVLVLVSLQ